MTKNFLCSISLSLILFETAVAQSLDPPKLSPTPPTEKESALVKEGIVLHDRGDYEGAVAKYEEALKDNPANVTALYEMAFSYSLKKDYRKSLETAYKGAQYKSNTLPLFYLMIGNNLDVLGDPKKAVEVFKKGIQLAPDNPLLHYNLAITYTNLNNPEEAKKSLKQAMVLNPDHASSHVALGSILYKTKYKTPALLALSRALILEPRSERAVGTFKTLKDILSGGASAGKNPNEINIFVDPVAKKDEGDFGSIDLILGLSRAVSMTEKNKGKPEAELMVEQFNTLFAMLSELEPKGDKSKFTWKYYAPYFIELKKRNYVEPFGYYISQRSGLDGVQPWLAANTNRLNEFLSWSKSYQWPKD